MRQVQKKKPEVASKKTKQPVSPSETEDSGSVVDSVISFIKQGLRTGRFAPGQRLIESDVCEQTGLGRSSVREAMRRLAAEGLVDIEYHKGVRIRHLDLQEALEIYQVREALEGLATSLAARNAKSGKGLARLLKLERDFDASNDGSPSKYMAYNVEFHRIIVELADNSRLTSLIELLELPAFLSLLHIITEPINVERSRAEHRIIVDALVAGKEKLSADAMRKHIARTAEHVRSHADRTNYGQPARRPGARLLSGTRK